MHAGGAAWQFGGEEMVIRQAPSRLSSSSSAWALKLVPDNHIMKAAASAANPAK
jgi:hypothetical protein